MTKGVKQPRRGFLVGAMVLSLSGFLSKLCGAVFRIPLTNLVGAEAMGYFGSAYSIYNFLLALATAGIPTGISTMVARSIAKKKYKDVSGVLKIAASIFVVFGGILSTLGIIFARPLAILMNSEDAYWCVVAIMPAVFFITVVAIFRGFFQGHNNMVPTACSNVIEAALKLFAGYGFALLLYLNGYQDQPAVVVGGAMAGVTLGTVLSAVFMLLRYLLRGGSYRLSAEPGEEDVATPRKALSKDFLSITFPIMISSVTSNMMNALDAFFVVNRMKVLNFSISQANLRWGCYGSMAQPLYNLPSFLITSIGTSLVPSISMAYARNDYGQIRAMLDKALKYTAILSFGCAFGLSAVSDGAVRLFYGARPAEELALGGDLLSILSIALIFVGMTNVTASILQSVGKAHMTVVSVAVGSVVKTISTFLLVSVPQLNIYGAPASTLISFPMVLLLNLIFIRKYLGYLPKFREIFVKPLICAAGCFGAVKVTILAMGAFAASRWAVFPQIVVGIVVYIALIFAVKLVSICEIRKIFKKS